MIIKDITKKNYRIIHVYASRSRLFMFLKSDDEVAVVKG